MNLQKIYLLSNKKYDGVENIEVFDISYIKKDISFEKFDALIFTSKNAIYSIDNFSNSWKKIPSYAIAYQTARIVEELNGNLAFTGTKSHGDKFALELLPLLENKKVLYLRAKKTVSNITDILKSHKINITEEIVYETICKQEIKKEPLEDNSIFIFTSPSSYNCFMKSFDWNDSFTAIAIGKTTAKEFKKNTNYFISDETSINSCIKLAKSLLK